MFSTPLRWRNLETQQQPVSLDLCLRKTGAGKSRDYRDVIVFEKFRCPAIQQQKASFVKFPLV